MTIAAKIKYQIIPLTKQHNKAKFNCGSSALDRYLREVASQDRRQYIAAPFVITDHESCNVIGFYTLSAMGIYLDDLTAEQQKKLPKYPMLPATRLGRLAVAQSHQGNGLGELLLIDALARSLTMSKEIASYAVVVDTKDDNAVQFYQRYGFSAFLGNNTGRLYLPMKTVAAMMATA